MGIERGHGPPEYEGNFQFLPIYPIAKPSSNPVRKESRHPKPLLRNCALEEGVDAAAEAAIRCACRASVPKILGSAIDLPVPTHYHSRHQSKPAPIMSLTIGTREVSHVTILDIQGRIILGPEIGELRNAVRDLVAQGKKKIILNLAHVDYLDSSGVGELVACFTTLRNAGGELKLLNLTQKVHDVLHVTKLYTVFDIKDDEFTAVKSFDYFFAK
jgi:anti-sigma B factor antagonist